MKGCFSEMKKPEENKCCGKIGTVHVQQKAVAHSSAAASIPPHAAFGRRSAERMSGPGSAAHIVNIERCSSAFWTRPLWTRSLGARGEYPTSRKSAAVAAGVQIGSASNGVALCGERWARSWRPEPQQEQHEHQQCLLVGAAAVGMAGSRGTG